MKLFCRLSLLILLIVSAFPLLAQTSANCVPPEGWETYVVEEGDTLYQIAQRHHTTVDALVAANCLPDKNYITIGEPLYVPPVENTVTTVSGNATGSFYAGRYMFNLLDSDPPVIATLQLLPDYTATLTIVDMGTLEERIITGTWAEGQSRVSVTFTQEIGDPPVIYDEPIIVIFAVQDGYLTTVIEGQQVYGASDWELTLGSGDYNPAVLAVQEQLQELGYMTAEDVLMEKGHFGEITRQAVVNFELDQGNPNIEPDGQVDEETWDALQDPQPVITPTPIPTPTPAPQGTPIPRGVPDLSTLPSHTPEGDPIAYFTFDDGPNPPYTQGMIDTLAKHNAKGTFFMLGQQAEYLQQEVRNVATAGHYVANHTYDHTSLEGLTHEQFMAEVERTNEILLNAAGDLFTLDGAVRFLRPPYGSTDANTRNYAAELGYAVVLWSIDPQDWRLPGVDQIVSNVMAHIRPGSIILMHDGGGNRQQSVDALDQVLGQLSAQGYVFRTIFDG